jgi:hypothetical protein
MTTRALRTLTILALLLALPVSAQAATKLLSVSIEPERPTSTDPIRITVTVLHPFDPQLTSFGMQGKRVRFEYLDRADSPSNPPKTWTAEAVVGPLPAGLYAVELVSGSPGFPGDEPPHVIPIAISHQTFEVSQGGDGLSFPPSGGSVFGVSLNFEFPSGSGHFETAHGVQLTRDSGFFWFFDESNIEVTIKILDGRGVNGKYWIFLSSMTDLKFIATITHCPTNPQIGAPCFSKTYESTQGVNRNIIDTNYLGF